VADDRLLPDWVPRIPGPRRRPADVVRYDPRVAAVPAVVRLWRVLTRYRRARPAIPRCRNCGYLIAEAAASPTGWTHGPHWQGVRCPGDVTGAEPRPGRIR
jgi:hypothetical protein